MSSNSSPFRWRNKTGHDIYLSCLNHIQREYIILLRCIHFFAENVKPKKPIDLAILKTDQQDLLDDDASLDSDEDDEDDKDDLDDLGDDTELADDPNTEDDEEDEDDYDEGDDWDTTPSSTTYIPKSSTTTSAPTTPAKNTPLPTPDPYFTHFDPRNEHQSYKEAQVFCQ